MSTTIAIGALVAIAAHLLLRFALAVPHWLEAAPLWIILIAGGGPLVFALARNVVRLEFGSDLLAGLSIVVSVLTHEYLVGAIVVLMLSGGQALESLAVRRASSALQALAKRMPTIAHRRTGTQIADVPLDAVRVDDEIVILPHETCPVDGTVIAGSGSMDESFLTGEPFFLPKVVGTDVISGATNGEVALVVRAVRQPAESRYAKILEVMRRAETERPHMRRLGDRLGAYYTPFAVGIALLAWMFSGDASRLLAVLVIATPCPLLIAIPVSIIGAISLCARRGVIVKDPAALEQVNQCRTAIFDKTGTLTYGRPLLEVQTILSDLPADRVLGLVASVERYSRHPLAQAVVDAATRQQLELLTADNVSESPGQGLQGIVAGRRIAITGRTKLGLKMPEHVGSVPASSGGLECIVLIDDVPVAIYTFRDEPRAEAAQFVQHLRSQHGFERTLIASGDRRAEVERLAARMGVDAIYAEQSPEEKVALVRTETARAPTLYIGDGINDAPALRTASVGISVNARNDITGEAASVVVPDGSLAKVDEFLHISRRMRRIALQCALGGMTLSVIGMVIAAFGGLVPLAGAIAQEIIDFLAVTNALRAAMPPSVLSHLRVPSELESVSRTSGTRRSPSASASVAAT